MNSPSNRDLALDRDALWSQLYPGSVPAPFLPGVGVPGINPIMGSQTPAFAAAITPDPTQGEIIAMAALTGAVTVNIPARQDGAPFKLGQNLMFIWVQDGTGGRVVTYTGGAGGFRTGGAAAFVTTLSTVTLDYFLFDGTNWRIWARITGQAI